MHPFSHTRVRSINPRIPLRYHVYVCVSVCGMESAWGNQSRDREFFEFHGTKKQKSPLQIYCSERTTHRATATNACQVEVDIDLLAAQPVVTVK